LGEAILAEVVATARYQDVTVLTTGPLGSTVGSLRGVSLAALEQLTAQPDSGSGVAPGAPPGAGPRVGSRVGPELGTLAAAAELDVFVCWGDAEDPLRRAYNRRDAIYSDITSADELRLVATAAARLQARRLLLVAPLRAWQQVSAAARMLPEAMEMELARLPIPVVVIMRPTTEHQAPQRLEGGRLQRFARFYLSQLRFMLPAVTQSLRSSEIARAAVAVMAEADQPGLTVVPLEEIRHHASRPRQC
jgi:hypothetical protein